MRFASTILVAVLLLLTACGGSGVSPDEFEAVQAEFGKLRTRVKAAETEIVELHAERSAAPAPVSPPTPSKMKKLAVEELTVNKIKMATNAVLITDPDGATLASFTNLTDLRGLVLYGKDPTDVVMLGRGKGGPIVTLYVNNKLVTGLAPRRLALYRPGGGLAVAVAVDQSYTGLLVLDRLGNATAAFPNPK